MAIPFISYTFDATTSTIAVSLPNSSAAVIGTYLVDAVFSFPGVYKFSLGLNLTIYDACAASTFPSPPAISPSTVNYLLGSGY